jgi:hypothetical protein
MRLGSVSLAQRAKADTPAGMYHTGETLEKTRHASAVCWRRCTRCARRAWITAKTDTTAENVDTTAVNIDTTAKKANSILPANAVGLDKTKTTQSDDVLPGDNIARLICQ